MMNTKSGQKSVVKPAKPYSKPKLIIYGPLGLLTQGANGSVIDVNNTGSKAHD